MTYTLQLVQSGFTGKELVRANELFRAKVEAALGGPDAVAEAYVACAAVIGPDSRVPVPPGSSYAAQEAVRTWRRAVALAFATVYADFRFDGSDDELASAVGGAHVRIQVTTPAKADSEAIL